MINQNLFNQTIWFWALSALFLSVRYYANKKIKYAKAKRKVIFQQPRKFFQSSLYQFSFCLAAVSVSSLLCKSTKKIRENETKSNLPSSDSLGAGGYWETPKWKNTPLAASTGKHVRHQRHPCHQNTATHATQPPQPTPPPLSQHHPRRPLIRPKMKKAIGGRKLDITDMAQPIDQPTDPLSDHNRPSDHTTNQPTKWPTYHPQHQPLQLNHRVSTYRLTDLFLAVRNAHTRLRDISLRVRQRESNPRKSNPRKSNPRKHLEAGMPEILFFLTDLLVKHFR